MAGRAARELRRGRDRGGDTVCDRLLSRQEPRHHHRRCVEKVDRLAMPAATREIRSKLLIAQHRSMAFYEAGRASSRTALQPMVSQRGVLKYNTDRSRHLCPRACDAMHGVDAELLDASRCGDVPYLDFDHARFRFRAGCCTARPAPPHDAGVGLDRGAERRGVDIVQNAGQRINVEQGRVPRETTRGTSRRQIARRSRGRVKCRRDGGPRLPIESHVLQAFGRRRQPVIDNVVSRRRAPTQPSDKGGLVFAAT